MHKIVSTSAVGALLLASWAAPVAAQNREHLQMAAELRMLQEQNQQINQALAQLAEVLKAVNARLDAGEQFQQRRFADQEVLVKNLSSDLSAIRERTQETDTRMRSLSDEIDALRKTFLQLPALIAQAQPQPIVGPAPAAGTVTPATAPSPELTAPAAAPPPAPVLSLPSTAGLSPNRMFETAWSDYSAGQYPSAISGFEELVKTFPQAERADDAQYLIGESLYHLSRFADAANAYNLVIQSYSTGDQVDMAYYKRGLAQERLGDVGSAKASWDEVVKRFPESSGASLARQSLVRVSRQAPGAAPARP
jgi:tol-pal system protein YbgF